MQTRSSTTVLREAHTSHTEGLSGHQRDYRHTLNGVGAVGKFWTNGDAISDPAIPRLEKGRDIEAFGCETIV